MTAIRPMIAMPPNRGGLGLGYTAARALEDARVSEMLVVELLQPVIDWHERGLVPEGPALTADSRCRFVQGDFFAMSYGDGYDPSFPGRLFDAVLLDIDHSPTHVLDDGLSLIHISEPTRL